MDRRSTPSPSTHLLLLWAKRERETNNSIPQPLLWHHPPLLPTLPQLPQIPRIHPKRHRQSGQEADVDGEEAESDTRLGKIVVPAVCAEDVCEAGEEAEEYAVDDEEVEGEEGEDRFREEEGPGG